MDSNNSNVISVAPDALVYINGKDGFKPCKDCSCDTKLRDVITSISVDLSVNSCPGSASIQIANPQHVSVPLIYKTESVFSAMQEVEIFMKGYFTHNDETVYHPVFWGFISTVNESYSDGTFNITISCKDILRWWEISRVNIRPSSSFVSNFYENTDPTIYQNIYSTMSIADIVFQISKITVNQLLKIDNITSIYTQSDSVRNFVKENTELMEYWKDRFLQIGRNLRVYGYTENVLNIESVDLTTNFKNIEGIRTLSRKIPDSLDAVGVNGPEINKFIAENLQTSEVNGLNDDAYETKLDTINKLKENIQYEFFMDPTGEILFKPPFYNINVRSNPIHVIKNTELISFNFSEDETAVITRVDVTGNLCVYDHATSVTSPVWDYFVDYYLSRRYGLRVKSYQTPWLRKKEQCKVYALSEISRLNALIKTGSVEIIGRAEARLGYPIYVEARDAFYYVTGIQHSFTFGGSHTTTLTLAGERKKIFNDKGEVQKNLAMKIVAEEPVDLVVENVVNYFKKEKLTNPNLTYNSVFQKMNYYLNQNKENLTLTADEYLNRIMMDSFSNTTEFENKEGIYENWKNKEFMSGFSNPNDKVNWTLPPKYTDAQIYKILRIIGESDEFKTTDSPNPLLRVSNQELDIEVDHIANKTVNATPFATEQNDVVFKNEDLSLNTIDDFLTKGIQITDEEGYFLIGVYNYGRNLTVLPTSSIGPKKLSVIEKQSSQLARKAFNVTLGGNEKLETSIKPEGINAIVTNPSALASQISMRSWDAVCDCGCHQKYKSNIYDITEESIV